MNISMLYFKLLNYIHISILAYLVLLCCECIRSIICIPLLHFMIPTVAATISTPTTAVITPIMMTKTESMQLPVTIVVLLMLQC